MQWMYLNPAKSTRSRPLARARARRRAEVLEALEQRLAFSAGTGLLATYYDAPNFTGPSVTRTDSTVNFDWASASPVLGIAPYTYSIRWVGEVQPRYTEAYTFHATGNDGVR